MFKQAIFFILTFGISLSAFADDSGSIFKASVQLNNHTKHYTLAPVSFNALNLSLPSGVLGKQYGAATCSSSATWRTRVNKPAETKATFSFRLETIRHNKNEKLKVTYDIGKYYFIFNHQGHMWFLTNSDESVYFSQPRTYMRSPFKVVITPQTDANFMKNSSVKFIVDVYSVNKSHNC